VVTAEYLSGREFLDTVGKQRRIWARQQLGTNGDQILNGFFNAIKPP
jgi:hypothetical protein